jgi:two-component system phosphate regulon response regulator PhoB
LIVEDDADVAEALALILQDAGFAAEIAPDGAQGLERLRAVREEGRAPPALILLDLMMPVMGGCDFRREQLRMRDAASIPVVILSAHAHAAHKAAEMGCADFLRKPVELDRLVDLVRRLSSHEA